MILNKSNVCSKMGRVIMPTTQNETWIERDYVYQAVNVVSRTQ